MGTKLKVMSNSYEPINSYIQVKLIQLTKLNHELDTTLNRLSEPFEQQDNNPDHTAIELVQQYTALLYQCLKRASELEQKLK